MAGRDARSAPLRDLLGEVRAHVPLVDADRVLGPEIGALCDSFRKEVEPDQSAVLAP